MSNTICISLGEIFAYPMYLHNELMSSKPRFIAMDVICKYWPYLHKSVHKHPSWSPESNIVMRLQHIPLSVKYVQCLLCLTKSSENKSLRCASGSGSPCRYLLSDNDRRTLHYPLHVFLLLDYMEWQKPRRSRVNCGGGSWTGEQLPLPLCLND